jgi:acyl-CoA dehydrogenase
VDNDDFSDIRTAVRRLVRDVVVPCERDIEELDAIPDNVRRLAAEMGLFGYALPEEYGGHGLRMTQDVQLAFEFGYTSPAFRSLFGTNNGIAGQVIARFGTHAQRARYLPAMAAGDLICSFALTEAEAGSDPSGIKTTATPVADGYRISGQKRFITNALLADAFVVFARTGDAASGHRSISCFLVESPASGLTVGPKDHKMGQAGAWTSEVTFDDVRVGPGALVGDVPGEGYRQAMSVLARGRLHVAALCVGMAERAIEEAVEYARTARQGGKPIGRFQLIQGMLAESYTEARAGRALVLEAAGAYERGEDVSTGPSAAKLFCSEMVGRVVDRAVQVHGGAGYMREMTVERLYRDARLYRIYEGTSEVQKVVIGRALMSEAGK